MLLNVRMDATTKQIHVREHFATPIPSAHTHHHHTGTCLNSCNERGQCLNQKCYCWSPYYGEHCEFGRTLFELVL